MSMFGCLLCTPNWGLGPQPRHVPWMWIETATLWFTSQHSIYWATPARWFYSVCDAKRWSSFIFLCVPVQFSQHHLLNKLPLAHCMCLLPLSNIDYKVWVYFGALSSVPLITYVFVFMPVPCCFHYYGLTV